SVCRSGGYPSGRIIACPRTHAGVTATVFGRSLPVCARGWHLPPRTWPDRAGTPRPSYPDHCRRRRRGAPRSRSSPAPGGIRLIMTDTISFRADPLAHTPAADEVVGPALSGRSEVAVLTDNIIRQRLRIGNPRCPVDVAAGLRKLFP